MTNRILVLGASGGCGKHVVTHALASGHHVTAMVRPETRYEPPTGAVVIRDDILRDGAIADAMRGHDVVISCVGIRRRHPRNPWSRLISPAHLVTRTAHAIVAGARSAGISRVLAVSAAGVGDSAPQMNWVMRFMVARSKIGVAYRDLAEAEAVFAASGLDWLAVRPVTLTTGRPKPVHDVDRFRLTATISRASVANWLVERLGDAPGSSGLRTPMIAS